MRKESRDNCTLCDMILFLSENISDNNLFIYDIRYDSRSAILDFKTIVTFLTCCYVLGQIWKDRKRKKKKEKEKQRKKNKKTNKKKAKQKKRLTDHGRFVILFMMDRRRDFSFFYPRFRLTCLIIVFRFPTSAFFLEFSSLFFFYKCNRSCPRHSVHVHVRIRSFSRPSISWSFPGAAAFQHLLISPLASKVEPHNNGNRGFNQFFYGQIFVIVNIDEVYPTHPFNQKKKSRQTWPCLLRLGIGISGHPFQSTNVLHDDIWQP